MVRSQPQENAMIDPGQEPKIRSSENRESWKWHIEEVFKGLVTLDDLPWIIDDCITSLGISQIQSLKPHNRIFRV
jgi:hypothetical protein